MDNHPSPPSLSPQTIPSMPGWKQLPRPDDLPPKPLRSVRAHTLRLPNELITLIADELILANQFKTVVALAQADGSAFSIIIPCLYHCVKLHTTPALNHFFWQLSEWTRERATNKEDIGERYVTRPIRRTRKSILVTLRRNRMDRYCFISTLCGIWSYTSGTTLLT